MESNIAEAYLKPYPTQITRVTESSIVWKDETHMPLGDIREKTFQERLENPSLFDQISIPYIAGSEGIEKAKEVNYDPGRLRYTPFFKKMYGETEEEVKKNLVKVEWLPKSFAKDDGSPKYIILVTKVNNVSEIISSISSELDDLCLRDDSFKPFLEKPGGTFNWRVIAGTDRMSAHSFGMTIDINVHHSNYWLWDYKKELGLPQDAVVNESDVDMTKFPAYRNKIPYEIVEIFEKHGFIWGGKWFHYDTMHFEYRPELLLENYQTTKVDIDLSGTDGTQIEQVS
ncbi:hypothetical protein phytr_7520 [Candidatus Phycorickettsia trachydisci]|uniref:Peptidase M15C domain-containing protein n=1 Tax=Candidatus Phycorickettsia trachydisci TaxID=2115978 RepID=A0A2P1P8U1_9RICK|nr:M15 family metallopeptidase [Candidatus Phycorickettsia trachydisci]AVP87689.1 hypothetical protein phytr_7520 [Candidatus Phycorickettsia trachydisci]